jgi:hypothetical protein
LHERLIDELARAGELEARRAVAADFDDAHRVFFDGSFQ